jgi:hypothetical protein
MRRAIVIGLLLCPGAIRAEKPIAVWRAFVKQVKAGKLTEADVRPYRGLSRATLVHFARETVGKTPLVRMKRPEVFRVGNQLHFVVQLSKEPPSSFCFTFVRRGGRWYYRHVENIFIRLDRVKRFPTSKFPPLPEARLSWMREEIRVTKMVRLFNHLKKEKGRRAALDFFRDGKGFFIAAKTWVPFLPPHRAFVLYLCWMETHLRGSRVTLESLTKTTARVRLAPHYLELYRRTGHLKHQIARRDYVALLETIWRDRAKHAGWKVELKYPEDSVCVMRFSLRGRSPG